MLPRKGKGFWDMTPEKVEKEIQRQKEYHNKFTDSYKAKNPWTPEAEEKLRKQLSAPKKDKVLFGNGYFDDILKQTQDIKDGGYKYRDGQWYKNSIAGMTPVSPSSVPKIWRDSVTIPKAPSRPKKGLLGGGPVEDALGKDVASIVNAYKHSGEHHDKYKHVLPDITQDWHNRQGFTFSGPSYREVRKKKKSTGPFLFGGGWEEELQKAMERNRQNEEDKKVAAQIMKAAAADSKKRTGKSIRKRRSPY